MAVNLTDRLKKLLAQRKQKTVELAELQEAMPGRTEYGDFALAVQGLLDEGILKPIKAAGCNGKTPPLPIRFKIAAGKVNPEFFDLLKRARLRLHGGIDLSAYYRLGPERWREDQKPLELLHRYLTEEGLPVEPASLQERSYAIFRDEKWLEEKAGMEFLQRVGLDGGKLALQPAADPCMFALQPQLCRMGDGRLHRHLIVENKTPFHALLPEVPRQGAMTSLIYGQGKAILATLQNFFAQTGFTERENHVFFYYGDLDYEGIAIWHSLAQRYRVVLATAFYRELLKKPSAVGKEGQRPQEEALEAFCQAFSQEEGELIRRLLTGGGYLPQEALTAEETRRIWREGAWISA